MSGARGWVIVGTHHLVVRGSREPEPSLASYGIVRSGVSPFHPMHTHTLQCGGTLANLGHFTLVLSAKRCNPSHLWLGTASDNVKDPFAKGRRVSPKAR